MTTSRREAILVKLLEEQSFTAGKLRSERDSTATHRHERFSSIFCNVKLCKKRSCMAAVTFVMFLKSFNEGREPMVETNVVE